MTKKLIEVALPRKMVGRTVQYIEGFAQ